jgi:murein DD-endopeptidase MepM/ murein hydrolase activator NlpD
MLVAQAGPARAAATIVWPVDKLPAPVGGQVYGAPRAYGGHKGTDFGRAAGTPIVAIAAGVVIERLVFDPGIGNTLLIQHAGFTSKYIHMQQPSPIAQGASVSPGTRIGAVGATGTSAEGNHLHLEIIENGVRRDPYAWLNLHVDGVPSPTTPPLQPPPQITKGISMFVLTATNGTASLVTPFGVVHLTDPVHRDLFVRLLNNPANSQVFHPIEVDIMTNYINSLVR